MQLKAILVASILASVVTPLPTESNDLTERAPTPQCFCCTGYFVANTAATECTGMCMHFRNWDTLLTSTFQVILAQRSVVLETHSSVEKALILILYGHTLSLHSIMILEIPDKKLLGEARRLRCL
jgi:hypothetical protein